MPFDESTPPKDVGQQQPGDTVAPLHGAAQGELPPQITESPGAMAHEAHGYSKKTDADSHDTVNNESVNKIPVTDGSEGFPMAINVRPLEEVERIPGVNAPFGDPDYVDSDRPSITQESTVEEDIGTAHAEARQVDFDMGEARTYRELAKEDADNGDLEGSKKWAEEARGHEKRARREGYWAGILHNRPVSQRFKQMNILRDEHGDLVSDFTPEVIIDLEDRVKYYQEIIDDISSGRASDPDYGRAL